MNLLCKVDPVQLCPLPAWPPVLYSLHSPKLFPGNDEDDDHHHEDDDAVLCSLHSPKLFPA